VLEALNPGALRRADAAATTIRGYLAQLAAERRRELRPDLLSALVTAQHAGQQLSEDELLTTTALLFAAGFETTTNLLTNSLVALLGNPGQLRLLREQPDLTRPAAEELLRFGSPCRSSAASPPRRSNSAAPPCQPANTSSPTSAPATATRTASPTRTARTSAARTTHPYPSAAAGTTA
jgi:Cytochrome P450